MTQGKKKKRAANRSIMLAKKIIIKDGGTVSAARRAPRAHPTPCPRAVARAPATPPFAGPPSRAPGPPGPGSAGFPTRPGLRPPGPDLGEGSPARPHLPPSPPATLGAWRRPTCAPAGDRGCRAPRAAAALPRRRERRPPARPAVHMLLTGHSQGPVPAPPGGPPRRPGHRAWTGTAAPGFAITCGSKWAAA